jgi:hypothetical protein
LMKKWVVSGSNVATRPFAVAHELFTASTRTTVEHVASSMHCCKASVCVSPVCKTV